MLTNLYFFHWPSDLGGADTRLKELIQLFSSNKNYKLYCIPNDNFRLKEQHHVDFLKKNNVEILTWESLPEKTHGYAIAFCNFRIFTEKWRLEKIKSIGLKFLWSNDMMWVTNEELAVIENNLVDAHLYTSQFHQFTLEKKYPKLKDVKNSFIIPNYFHLENYKTKKIKKKYPNKFVVGKLSRADFGKFSENFPLFYEKMPIKNPLFRVMGVDKKILEKYSWHSFENQKWELLPENSENSIDFLSQLDLYVFNANHNYTENQTRAMVEALLCGVPAIAPNYGNFPNIIWHGKNGFIYDSIEECYEYIKLLSSNKALLKFMKTNSEIFAKQIWCNKELQTLEWESIFKNL